MSSSAILTALSSSNTGMGTGIDVTSTVSAMITALRIPETQWQNQQRTLQNQINALDQLNTEASNLSTAVDALNDSSGAISARTVSSSQTGVVTASAANSAAVGNHVVVVNRLASTSSYYSDELTDGSPLTNGVFTIQVGTGQPTTITIDSSNNTLDKLAGTINSQNLGVTASVVKDANGSRLAVVSNNSGSANDLTISSVTVPSYYTDPVGSSSMPLAKGTLAIQIGTATPTTITVDSSNNTLDQIATTINNQNLGVTATVVTDQSGAHLSVADNTGSGSSVTITSQPADSAYYTNSVASGSTTLAAGSLSIQVGSGPAAIVMVSTANNTLDQIATTINNQSLGVTATVITDSNGAHLSVVDNSGTGNAVTLTSSPAEMGFTKAVTGKNAALTVDGVPISSASNTVSGSVNGLTLNLLSAAPGSEIQVGVSTDTARVTQSINDFVSAYNTMVQDLNSQFKFNEGTKTGGTLSGDGGTRAVQSQILGDIGHVTNGTNGFNTLQSLGISMNNDGTLTVDAAALSSAVSNHAADVQNFFQAADGSGFATMMHSQLFALTSPTQGAFNVEIKGKTDNQYSLQDQIDNFEIYITSKQQELTAEYQRVDALLRELPLLQQQLNVELGFTNNNNSSK